MVITRFMLMVVAFPEFEATTVRLGNSVFIIGSNLSKKKILCNVLIENLFQNTKKFDLLILKSTEIDQK